MKRCLLFAACTLVPVGTRIGNAFAQSPPAAMDSYRPAFHFTPEKNWMNDPNGLVFDGAQYHLFYQYNPFGNKPGHLSWGHAVSKDLLHWQHLPVALTEENDIMMFSGSAVVDSRNTSGFGRNGAAPLVAFYTGHSTGKQTQNIAYSTDRGRTWTKYSGNPVIDIHEADFRDPMVLWHAPSRQWVMLVSLANAHKVQFYSSKDLNAWRLLSEFGPAGAKGISNWECPNIFELPVANAAGRRKWVLEIGVGDGAPVGGSASQYFIGDFDGTRFVNDNPPDKTLWVDYGADFYAAQTWSGIPASDGRRLVLAWMSNWKYAERLPTGDWRGQMTIPRELGLLQTEDGLRLTQKPARELASMRSDHAQLRNASFRDADALLTRRDGSETLEIIAELELAGLKSNGAQDFGFELRKGPSFGTRVGYDAQRGVVYVDRTRSGDVLVSPQFPARHEAALHGENGKIQFHIILDRLSVEVFGGDGRVAITDLIFPRSADKGLGAYAVGNPPQVISLDIWNLKARPGKRHVE